MYINADFFIKSNSFIIMLLILFFSSFLYASEERVCFYENEGFNSYDGGVYCQGAYSQIYSLNDYWNNKISSIKIPYGVNVFVYSEKNFFGYRKELKKDVNAVDLMSDNLHDNISSIRILPDSIYPESNQIIFAFLNEANGKRYLKYDYNNINKYENGFNLLSAENFFSEDSMVSSSIYYTSSGQVITAFFSDGIKNALYCLAASENKDTIIREEFSRRGVYFTHCDMSDKYQRWTVDEKNKKMIFINRGSETPLSFENGGFFIYSKDSRPDNYHMVELSRSMVDDLRRKVVKPFPQYKIRIIAGDIDTGVVFIANKMNENVPNYNYLFLSDYSRNAEMFYNLETLTLLSYNLESADSSLKNGYCLGFSNEDGKFMARFFANYFINENVRKPVCYNGVRYYDPSIQWIFMPDDKIDENGNNFHHLINLEEKKALHFTNSDGMTLYTEDRPIELGPYVPADVADVPMVNSHDVITIDNPVLNQLLAWSRSNRGDCTARDVYSRVERGDPRDNSHYLGGRVNRNFVCYVRPIAELNQHSIDQQVRFNILVLNYIPYALRTMLAVLNDSELITAPAHVNIAQLQNEIVTLQSIFDDVGIVDRDRLANQLAILRAIDAMNDFLQVFMPVHEYEWDLVALIRVFANDPRAITAEPM
ncbi:beta/Gamma crystallin family protein [Yersinia ruckeri]|uniref:hypothetical protein n=1 Tax=Yersinia ruckeri TaxID=29486 RepID=UPI0005ACB34B|nr:hypothetical protein [Yersinia ruckeri]AJI94705.1 beta/Gamma crystallin family protein [Yersinia ruckeri]MCW6568517.1 beta/gamma crystallin family protein [Yersinia ruckeri]